MRRRVSPVLRRRSQASNALFLTGNSGSYASTPDHADLDITGDIDIRCAVAMNDWTPSAVGVLIAKEQTTSTRSYRLRVETNGTLSLTLSTDGAVTATGSSSVAVAASDRAHVGVRVTWRASDGRVQFFTKAVTPGTSHAESLSNSGWTQLGTDASIALVSIFSGSSQVEIGSTLANAASRLEGRILAAVIKNGIDGTTAFSADFTKAAQGARSFTESTGKVVTVNGSAFVDRYETGGVLKSLRLPGVSGSYASTPDAAALDIVGDIDLRVQASMDDWTPAAISNLFGKYDTTANNRSYQLRVDVAGTLTVVTSPDGIASRAHTSTVATGITDGAVKWVRGTVDVDNGAAGSTARFYTSDDGVTWTQLGTDVVTAGATSIFSSTAPLEIGTITIGTLQPLAGRVRYAEVKNGYDGAGSVVFAANFNRPIGETSFVCETGQTVTLNGNARYTYEAS